MKFTKEKLLSLVKQNLHEMPMDFDGPERPDTDVERDLQRGDTPLSIVPTPETNRADQNFFELLASERYREVVDRVRQITDYHGPISGRNTGPLGTMMWNAHIEIMRLESEHKEALIAMAIEVVKKEMGLPEDIEEYINFVVDLKSPNLQGFNRGGQISPPKQQTPNVQDAEILSDDEIAQITPENREMEMELFQDVQNIDTTQELEESKYRLIKAIIAGASKKGHWMYTQLRTRLREITGSDTLFDLYGVMMSVNDLNYWQFDKSSLRMSSVAGRVDIVRPTQSDDNQEDDEMTDNMGGDDDEDEDEDFTPQDERIDPRKTNIIVQGVNFPVLVHELLKGLLKTFALQGQPKKDMFVDVREKQEKLEYEIWDLRLGPSIWRRLNDSFPPDLLEDHNRELQNYIMTEIFKLPAKKFLVLMKEVMGETERGKRLVSLIYDGIIRIMNDEDYQEAIKRYETELTDVADNTDDDQLINELNGIFGEKGFTLSKDDLGDDDDREMDDDEFLNQFR
jgi:hypothetical protein